MNNVKKTIGLNDISVVIPMYNSESTIIKTLDSIKKQTVIEYIREIIIVNDGSTDSSRNIVGKYSENNQTMNIKLIDIENGGVSNARNIGMKNATGDWIALLDSDDEWYSNKLDVQTDIINSIEDIDFLGAEHNNKGMKIFIRPITQVHKVKTWEMFIRSFPQPSTVIFKKKIFCELGGFDVKQSYCEDINYFTIISSKYNMYHYPFQLSIFDGGKSCGAHKGLSSNMRQMQKGTIKNLKDFRKEKIISIPFYIFLYIFYWLKYIRRLVYKSIENS